jgi:hypothetical protein
MQVTSSETYQTVVSTASAFAGGTTNARGDNDGTSDPKTIFTVTGVVAMKIFGHCTVNLAGTGTVELGTAKNTAGLIAQTTGTDIDADEIWHDATPDASVEAITVAPEKIVCQNVIETVGTADITSGQIVYYCMWRPISNGASVVAAG